MKTHPVAAILTSAYLSAMLTSSLAPIRNNTIFAAAVDPMAAQKAFQGAVSGLDAAGWAAAVSGTPAPVPPVPQPVAATPTPKADPVMTAELLARLIAFTQDSIEGSTVAADICAIFDLCDGTAPLLVKLVESEQSRGLYFTLPQAPGSKDIIIVRKRGKALEAYLTDRTLKLRAAAISEGGVSRLITNEKAAEKYKAELSRLAREAADLPPTGTAVAGS